MKIKKIGTVSIGQDGAIWGGYLFRFGSRGECCVYDLGNSNSDLKFLSEFKLDKSEILAPHSNSVSFGKEFFSEEDEFPLLYTNIYNNYRKEENPLKGVTCVYRLQRKENLFTTTLVQIIEIGFVENTSLWKSESEDVRPYGNFAIDRQNDVYYAFTMIDEKNLTRYFSFPLPKLKDGIIDKKYGVNKVVLQEEDIKEYFDCEYHRYLQGACFHKGKIYSLEGFTENIENPPVLRIINANEKRQERVVNFSELGYAMEPEFIDFYNDKCYYADLHGTIYQIEFE